jgi:hypothetical protein
MPKNKKGLEIIFDDVISNILPKLRILFGIS